MVGSIGIVAMRVDGRSEHAPELQEVLTRYGSVILCRHGIPSPDRETGIITLTCECDGAQMDRMSSELGSVPGVTVKSVTL